MSAYILVFCSELPCLVCNALTPGPQAAVSMLKQDYKEGEMTLSSALALAVKVLNKTMDVSKLSAEKGEAQADILVILYCYIVSHRYNCP